MRRLTAVCLPLLVAACATAGRGSAVDHTLCAVAQQPADWPLRAAVLLEIPAGGREKAEYSAREGRLVVDRVLPDSLAFPEAYGTFPCTLAGDGDPLDAVLLEERRAAPGAVLLVRPIAVLHLMDNNAQDDKIIVVPVDSPTQELDAATRERLTRFFTTYKGAAGNIVIRGWGDRAAAHRVLAHARTAAVPLD